MKTRIRGRVSDIFRKMKMPKSGKTLDMIGCEWAKLKQHIQNQFKDGMKWSNRNLWHIDHIIPLSSAKNEEELYKLCHYTNLQPLWAKENLSKGSKILTHL